MSMEIRLAGISAKKAELHTLREYHRSQVVRCPTCSHRKRGNDTIEHFHAMLAATVVAPGNNRAAPLEPEFIVPQDGHDKQDCESRAAGRWMGLHGAQYRRFDPV